MEGQYLAIGLSRLAPHKRIGIPISHSVHPGGAEELEIEASDIRQLLRVPGEHFPKMRRQLHQGIAVAVDGEIYQDGWLEPIAPDSEVHLLPRIGGGKRGAKSVLNPAETG